MVNKKRSTSGSTKPKRLTRAESQFLAKLWADDDFRQTFKDNPKQVLKDNRIAVPAGLNIKVVEDKADLYYIVIPFRAPERSVARASVRGVVDPRAPASGLTRRPEYCKMSLMTRRPRGSGTRRGRR
jgi:hypothetical protein